MDVPATVRNVTVPALFHKASEVPMPTVIIVIALTLLIIWAVWRIRIKSKRGGGCCPEHEETVCKVKVKDKNKSHYPYQYTLQIGGMTCDNCARRVENALNSLPGAWANVDVSSEKAVLRMKEKTGEAQIKDAVASSGYTVLDIS